MSNEYYQAGSSPAPNSPGASAVMRGQFTAIAAAFDKLPTMAGSADEFVLVNSSGTALIASGYLIADFVTVTGTQTVTNKTFAWGDNTWPGFGTGATKNAGTLADQVLLLSADNKLPALDGGLLTALPDDASLGGAPTATTPIVGDASDRIATARFVAETVTAVGGATPSNATPNMNGAAAPGTAILVSRDDHVHPTDTSRAPSSASTAAGTSLTPVGGIAATNVQAAIAELDSEKAPSSASTAAGTSLTPVGGVAATDVQAAIAELDSEKAPSSASTAVGTSFTPGGGIIATNVQAAIAELDSEKAPVAQTVLKTSGTGAYHPPVGTTAQRPVAGLLYGDARTNSELDLNEWWNGTDWVPVGGVPLAGFRNILIDAGFQINTRGYTSGAVLAAGAYGHDRWKAGANGGDYTFTQLKSATQITIAPGKSIIQVVEDANVEGGTYILAWDGSAKARIGLNSSTPSGAYATSPILITGQLAGVTTSVEYTNDGSGGTLFLPQEELGSIPSRKEIRPIGVETLLCKRYLPSHSAGVGGQPAFYTGQAFSNSTGFIPMPFQVDARVPPTGVQIVGGSWTISGPGGNGIVVSIAFNTGSVGGGGVSFSGASGLTAGHATALGITSGSTLIWTGCEL